MERKYLYLGLALAIIGFFGSVTTSLVIIGVGLILYGKITEAKKQRSQDVGQFG